MSDEQHQGQIQFENTYIMKPQENEKFKVNEVTKAVKALLDERLKVTIGEVQGQGVRIASRCLWDVETDNHASAHYTNPHLYCVAMVFACYYE